MGVAGLWEILQPSATPVPLSLLSLSYILDDPSLLPFPRSDPGQLTTLKSLKPSSSAPPLPRNQELNALRLGIDASLWIFHARVAPGGSNPFLRTMFFKVLRLLREGVACLFVFDGPNKPRLKRNQANSGAFGSRDVESRSFKALLDEMGLEWWNAPGEAEAELAHLTRQGMLDAVLTDDVDALLFEATCVLRNPSKTLSANVTAAANSGPAFETRDDYQVYRSEAIEAREDIGLDVDGLILIGLMSGGDYHTAGIPKCGPKIAHGIARSGLAHELLDKYRTLSPADFRAYLPTFVSDLKHELSTNESGFLPNRRKALADSIPSDFPDLDVLDYYVNPAVSKAGEGWRGFGLRATEGITGGTGRPGAGKRCGRGDPRGFARACERWFEWGYKAEVGRRMRTLVWRGEIIGYARESLAVRKDKGAAKVKPAVKGANSATTLDGTLTAYFTHASSSTSTWRASLIGKAKGRSPSPSPVREYGAFPRPRLISISALREHPSTGLTPEYRVEYDPSEWSSASLDAMDGTRLEPRFLTDEQRMDMGMIPLSQSDFPSGSEASTDNDSVASGATPRKKREKREVDLEAKDKAWIPVELVKRVWPEIAEEYGTRMRAKAEKATTPKKKRAAKRDVGQPVEPSKNGFLSGWLIGKTRQPGKPEVEQLTPTRERLRSESPDLEVVEVAEIPEVPEDQDSRRTIRPSSNGCSLSDAPRARSYPMPPPEYAHIPFATPSPPTSPKKRGARPALSLSPSSAENSAQTAVIGAQDTRQKESADKPTPRKSPKRTEGASDGHTARKGRIRSPSPTPKPKVISKTAARRTSIHAIPPGRRLPLGRRNSDVIDLTDSDDEVFESPETEDLAKPKHWAGKSKPGVQPPGMAVAIPRKKTVKKPAPGFSSSTSYFETPRRSRTGAAAGTSTIAELDDSDSTGSELEDPQAMLRGLRGLSTGKTDSMVNGGEHKLVGPSQTRSGNRGRPDLGIEIERQDKRQHLPVAQSSPGQRKGNPELLPVALLYNDEAIFVISRLWSERALLHGSILLAIGKLLKAGEIQVSIELGTMMLVSMAYIHSRSLGHIQIRSPVIRPLIRRVSQRMFGRQDPAVTLSAGTDRVPGRPNSVSAPAWSMRCGWQPPERSTLRHRLEEELAGCHGRVWATDEKDYRECIDDGISHALLLGPMLAASMFYDSWKRLRPPSATMIRSHWKVESPLVLPSTPDFHSSAMRTSKRDDYTLTRIALALSRRHLIHLTCMLSLASVVHLLYSRSLEKEVLTKVISTATGKDGPAERSAAASPLLYWSKRGEWRRSAAIILFAMWVMIGFVSIKAGAHYMGWTAAYDLTYTDIILAILFYQFCLYVCVRLARKGFTLGELGIICHAATALFMETVNLTRFKISVFRTPYIRTYRMATPLLIFQLALIPGSFLTGFLLSPILVLSRKIARRPEYRMRLPTEKQTYRKALAAAFYGGSAIVCGGIIAFWTRWCLGGRDPWAWVIRWLMKGATWWSRPALITYWGLLAAISVAGWTRQLARARKKRPWTETSVSADGRRHLTVRSSAGGLLSDGPGSTPRTASPIPGQVRSPSVASQVMDNINDRLPTFGVNARRKFFHALAVVLFVPGIILDPAFTHLACSVAFAGFIFAEYIRYFAVYPFGAAVHLFLNEFLDSKDSGTAIMSHFYLLTGCASGLWLEGPSTILNLFGVLALGVGDALASVIGKRYGRIRWSTSSKKTVEGSLAFFLSVTACGYLLRMIPSVDHFSLPKFGLMTALVAVMEALSEQNDNLILPIWGWCLGVLLDV